MAAAQGHLPGHHGGHLRRQVQLVGRLRPVGLHAVRPRGRPAARRRPGQVDRRGPRDDHRNQPFPPAGEYPVVERNDAPIRAFKEDVLAHFGKPLIDVRSAEEYTGQRTHMPAYPEEGALRGGHIPTAASVPWARAAAGTAPTAPVPSWRPLPGRGRAQGRRRRRRVLPYRRAVQPHVVRPQVPAGLRHRPQLRRLLDRMGQRRARPDRQGLRPRHGSGRPLRPDSVRRDTTVRRA